MTSRNTKQKTGILNLLRSRYDHPTAEMIYTELKKTMPNISLGTVYRNLSAMAENGQVSKLRFDDGLDHFDATTGPHHHFICRKCGKVIDIPTVKGSLSVSKEFDGEILGSFTYFYGMCRACK